MYQAEDHPSPPVALVLLAVVASDSPALHLQFDLSFANIIAPFDMMLCFGFRFVIGLPPVIIHFCLGFYGIFPEVNHPFGGTPYVATIYLSLPEAARLFEATGNIPGLPCHHIGSQVFHRHGCGCLPPRKWTQWTGLGPHFKGPETDVLSVRGIYFI